MYVELGAGKGMLSLAVAQCVGGEGRVVLVDRDDVAAHSRLDKTIAVCNCIYCNGEACRGDVELCIAIGRRVEEM